MERDKNTDMIFSQDQGRSKRGRPILKHYAECHQGFLYELTDDNQWILIALSPEVMKRLFPNRTSE